MEREKDMFTIPQIAKIGGVCQNSLRIALRSGRIKAVKINKKWFIKRKDYIEYLKSKWSRQHSTFEGELLYDKSKGEYSVVEAAKLLKVKANKIYYLCRLKKIPFKRKNTTYVFNIKDLEDARKRLSFELYNFELVDKENSE